MLRVEFTLTALTVLKRLKPRVWAVRHQGNEATSVWRETNPRGIRATRGGTDPVRVHRIHGSQSLNGFCCLFVNVYLACARGQVCFPVHERVRGARPPGLKTYPLNCVFVLFCSVVLLCVCLHPGGMSGTRVPGRVGRAVDPVGVLKEDLAAWLKDLYRIDVDVRNILRVLETGALLCAHANNVTRAAAEFERNRGRTGLDLPRSGVTFTPSARPQTFQARDNVSNFISWCRNQMDIKGNFS